MPTLKSMIYSRQLNFFTKYLGNLKDNTPRKDVFVSMLDSGCDFMSNYSTHTLTKMISKNTFITYYWQRWEKQPKHQRTISITFTDNLIQNFRHSLQRIVIYHVYVWVLTICRSKLGVGVVLWEKTVCVKPVKCLETNDTTFMTVAKLIAPIWKTSPP